MCYRLLTPCAIVALAMTGSAGARSTAIAEFEGRDPGVWSLHDAASLDAGRTGRGLRLPEAAHAQWRPEQRPTTQSGTLTVWVSPLWRDATASHPFVTFAWSGEPRSYFALSRGWWEPQGTGRLFAIVSNQDQAGCRIPWEFDYSFFRPDAWTMLTVVWQAGEPGFMRLYVDGARICQVTVPLTSGRALDGAIYFGSDLGSTVRAGRRGEVHVDDVSLTARVKNDREIWHDYVRGGGTPERKWVTALLRPTPDAALRPEVRLIQDEDQRWASSPLEIRRRVARIKAAGFNVYMPCVWNGGTAAFATTRAPSLATRGFDPLAELIAVARAAGIEVHPWFEVMHRAGATLPGDYALGAPPTAYDVHNETFRDFIVGLMTEAVTRYDVDGLNLDYIRAVGNCTSTRCNDAYRARYQRDLAADWATHERAEVPTLLEWNRSAVTDIVRRVSQATRAARPQAIVSIDTTPFSRGRKYEGVDAAGWLAAGLIDVVVYMEYEEPFNVLDLDRAATQWPGGRLIVLPQMYDTRDLVATPRAGGTLADYVQLVRSRWPGTGIGFYHYPHLNDEQSRALTADVFAQAVPPAWPRRER